MEVPPWLSRVSSCQLSILCTSKPAWFPLPATFLPAPGDSLEGPPCLPRGALTSPALTPPCSLPGLLGGSLAKWTGVPKAPSLYAAGPGSSCSRLWEEGGLLDSPLGGWTKSVQGGPRGLWTQGCIESPGRAGCGLGQSRQRTACHQ